MLRPPLLLLVLSSLAQLAAAGRPEPPEVCIVREGWDAAVTPEEVRDALAPRLHDRRVSVCDTAPAEGCRVHLGPGTFRSRSLRVACAGSDGLGPELRDEVADAPREEMVRWVAVEAAALLGAAALARRHAAPADGAAPASAPASAPVPVSAVDPETPRLDTPASPPDRDARPRLRLALGAGGGIALAPELPVATYAFVINARVFVWRDVHLFGGLKLAGPFVQHFGEQRDSVADRAFWLGAGYRAAFSHVFLDVALAGQYVIPILDTEGVVAPNPLEEMRASRFSLRAAVELGWRFHASLAAVVVFAGSMSFFQRDHVAAGRDTLELGTAIIDATAGLEVGF